MTRKRSKKQKTLWAKPAAVIFTVGAACYAFNAPKADGATEPAQNGHPLSLAAQRAKQAHDGGWSNKDLPTVVAIGFAESSLDNHASHHNTDSSIDRCWLQVNSKNRKLTGGRDLSDPTNCARAAKTIYDAQGFHAWSTVNSGAYRKFMPQARAAVSEAGLS